MKNKKQIIRNGIIFLLLIIITFIIIFKNHNFEDTIKLIFTVNYKYIILAIIVMFLDFVLESINIKNLLSSLGTKVSLLKTLKYTLIGFFFSGITPAASGGQPMEIYFMKKDNIPITKSTLVLLIELCSFHIVTISSGIIGAIINHKLLSNGFIWIFIIGSSLNIIALSVMLVGLFSKRISKSLVNLFIKILKVFKYSKIDTLKENINSSLQDYQEGSTFIKKHKLIFIKSIITVFFQVLMYYSVSYFVYRSFNLNTYSYFKIISISAMLFISISSMPLPGTVGISESAFLKIYLSIYGIDKLASAMLLNRGINFYLYIIVSFIVVILSLFNLKSKNILKKEKIC